MVAGAVLTRSERRAKKRKRTMMRKALAKLGEPELSKAKQLERPVEWIEELRGGREVIDVWSWQGSNEYFRRIQAMADRQNGLCGICETEMGLDMTFDHENGRGMGGGHRDDRIELPDGTWINRAVHAHCNMAKGSKRGYENPSR